MVKDSTGNNIAKFIGNSIQATAITKEANNIAKVVENGNQIANLMKKAQEIENLYAIEYFDGYFEFTNIAKEEKYYSLLDKVSSLQEARSGFNLFNFFGIGTVFSVGIGAYCTHSYCENLLNKFAEFYRKNADKITNSYEEAISYFKDENI